MFSTLRFHATIIALKMVSKIKIIIINNGGHVQLRVGRKR
jgi:ApbE superfamily uncharacterized protein (UPF0280 family)